MKKAIAKPILRIAGGLALLAVLGSCIQGPWDYYPKDPPIFQGIWVTGYAIAGKPIKQLCMERFHDLSEENTNAFAFYDSADVRVSGRFNDSTVTLRLFPRADAPNCFTGDSTALVRPGHDYAFTARITWDSAGVRVTSTMTATAQVPDSFSIRRQASAPGMAITGNLPGNIFSPEFLEKLPPNTRQTMIAEYGETWAKLQGDSAAMAKFIATDGPKVQARLEELLKKEQAVYKEGDTLFYLSGALNTLSHYYTSDYSEDVAGVLITHRFDPEAERPEDAFSNISRIITGKDPDTSSFYYEGETRRLGMWTAAVSPSGYNLLDSIGVVNVWFITRRNRLYFYGVEDAYVNYVNTAIMSGGDPRVKPEYNVQGGRGIFIGAVPDSFDVYIKVDPLTRAYSLPEAHAAECRDDGWFNEKDCSDYYRTWCQGRGWNGEECRVDAVRGNLEALLKGDTVLALATDSAAAEGRLDTVVANLGKRRFCLENNFPAEGENCDADRRSCLENAGINTCKETLWEYCRQNRWVPAQCGEGLAWYCRDKPRTSEIMCRQADAFCRNNPGVPACRK